VGTRRVSYFLEGRLARTHSYGDQPTQDGSFVTVQLPFGDGTFAGIMAPEIGAVGEPPPMLPILRIDADGRELGHLAELRHEYPSHLRFGTARTATLFHDRPLFEVSRRGDRLVIVDRPFPQGDVSQLFVHAIAPTGDTVFSRELRGRAIALSEELWEARLKERRDALPNSTIDETEYLRAVRRPRALTPATSLVIGAGGWTWIARENMRTAEVLQWIAVDPSGRPRFRIDLPRAFRVYDIVGTRVWGVALDSLDIPYVRMYEIEP